MRVARVVLALLALTIPTLAAGPQEDARLAWERALAALAPAGEPGPGGLWLVVVEGDGQRPAWAARVLTDRALWRDLEGAGHRWRVLAYADPLCTQKGYAQLADRVDKPALLLVAAGGRVLNVRTLPDSAAGVRDVVKEYAR